MKVSWDDYSQYMEKNVPNHQPVMGYPLANIQKAIENGPVEIVDFPSYKMVIVHSYVTVYQRVS